MWLIDCLSFDRSESIEEEPETSDVVLPVPPLTQSPPKPKPVPPKVRMSGIHAGVKYLQSSFLVLVSRH